MSSFIVAYQKSNDSGLVYHWPDDPKGITLAVNMALAKMHEKESIVAKWTIRPKQHTK